MSEADRQSVRQLLTGDHAGVHQFVRTWQPRIARWIAQSNPPMIVEDYTQEILCHLAADGWRRLRAWRGLYSGTYNPNSLAAYIKIMTIRKMITLQRADRKQLPGAGDPFDIVDDESLLGLNPLESAEGERLMVAISACLNVFKRKDRNLLVMWRQGHKDRHTARILQTNENNVRQRRRYLLKKLRVCLIEKLPGYFSDI